VSSPKPTDRKPRCALRSDDTEARNDILSGFGRSDRRAQQPHNQLMIESLRSGLLIFAPKHQYLSRATFDPASNHNYTHWGWYNLRIR
jgi:hypothetical protein